MIDVLPAALRSCAAQVRAVELLGGTVLRTTGSAALDAALGRFTGAGTLSARALVAALDASGDELLAAAEEYADVEALLVPRHLR